MFLAHQGSSFDEVAIMFGVVLLVMGIIRAFDRRLTRGRRWAGSLGRILVGGFSVVFAVQQMTSQPPMNPLRIASTATLAIENPAAGSSLTGPGMDLRVRLEGATLSREATSDLRPDAGHLHASIDGQAEDRWIELVDRIPIDRLDAGQHLLVVEFVATDHGPFAPPIRAVTSFRIDQP